MFINVNVNSSDYSFAPFPWQSNIQNSLSRLIINSLGMYLFLNPE